MDGRRALERLRRAVGRLASAGLDTATFAERLCEALRPVLPHRAACVVTVDPETCLLTGTYKFGDLAGRHELDHEWARLEYGADDPTAMAALAGREVPAAAVSHLPGGLDDSPRAVALLAPAGYGDELRVLAHDGTRPWGGVNLFRRHDDPPFTATEVEVAGGLADVVAGGLRAAAVGPVRVEVAPPIAAGPAVILVAADGRIRHTSPAAADLLAAATDDAHRSPPDSFVHGLVAAARRGAVDGDPTVPQARVRLPDGRWLVGRAGLLHPAEGGDGPEGEVVITVEEARPAEVLPLLAAGFGLTSREQDVTQLVLAGVPTKGIVEALHVSAYTVQDHLKSVFAKMGVRSRNELMARIYRTHAVLPA